LILDAIEFGGAKLIKCHAQWNCDDKCPGLQIIDAAADIYLFKTPAEEKSESAHAQHTMLQRKSPLLQLPTFIPKSIGVLLAA
jgi:hypothetical protein